MYMMWTQFQVKDDWKYMALVIDRLFLYIYISVCLVGSLGVLLNAPVLYDNDKPLHDKAWLSTPTNTISAKSQHNPRHKHQSNYPCRSQMSLHMLPVLPILPYYMVHGKMCHMRFQCIKITTHRFHQLMENAHGTFGHVHNEYYDDFNCQCGVHAYSY